MKTLNKYIHIYFLFFRNCLLSQMEYRLNFFAGIVVDFFFLFDKVIYAFVVYNLNVSIYGLTPEQVVIFIGSYAIILSIYCAIFLVNINVTLPGNVKSGNLDIILTKPISTQFYLSTSYVEYATMIPDLFGGIFIVVLACVKMGMSVSFLTILGYIFFIIISVVIIYGLYFCIQLLTFYITDTSAIGGILNSLLDLNNMPMHVYNKVFRNIFLFVFPVLLFGNLAPLFFIGQLSLTLALWGIFVAVGLIVLSIVLWRHMVKKYTSING